MRLLYISIRAPNTPGPNFMHVCLSIICPFCISCRIQLAPVMFSSNRSERNLTLVLHLSLYMIMLVFVYMFIFGSIFYV
jgi:hypothetical protein